MTQRRVRRVRRDRQARRRVARTVPAAALVLVLASAGTAFTAGLDIAPSSAGRVTATFPTYAVTSGPDFVAEPAGATITISPVPRQLQARTAESAYVVCTRSGDPATWSCPVPGTTGFVWFANP